MKVSIVIPVYNETNTILTLLDMVMAIDLTDKEIIVVDDGSYDGTNEKLKVFSEPTNPSVKVVFHEKNKFVGTRGDRILEYVVLLECAKF